MVNLTFEGIKKVAKGQTEDLPDGVVLQILSVKSCDNKNVTKKWLVSWGNYSTTAVLTLPVEKEMARQGKNWDVQLYDIVKFNKFKVSHSNDRTVLVTRSVFDIIKTGLKTKIGNPVLYDDVESGKVTHNITKDNCIVDSNTKGEEESKGRKKQSTTNRRDSSPILRKSGVASKSANDLYTPIMALNTLNPDWMIKAKVTNKGAVRTFTNQRGEGKLFNFELADSHGGQIQATCFGTACDKFEPMIHQGTVYIISKGDVKMANKRFSSIKNDYCLILNDSASVEVAQDQNEDIADVQFDFTPISELATVETVKTIDIIGVVIADNGTREINTKNGNK